jgi:hypothetical protein
VGSQEPDTPLPSASSLPGGHATGVDSGHRLRTETRSTLTKGLWPPHQTSLGPQAHSDLFGRNFVEREAPDAFDPMVDRAFYSFPGHGTGTGSVIGAGGAPDDQPWGVAPGRSSCHSGSRRRSST